MKVTPATPLPWKLEYVEQPNSYGGCHWIIRHSDGHIHARYYDENKARALLRELGEAE